jgi:hypothetical protein
MPSYDEVVRSLYGAYLLARADRSGMAHFDLSVDGFWRSFFAAVLALPGYVIIVAGEVALGAEAESGAGMILARGVVYVVGWIAFPVAALVLCRLLGLGSNYVALIIAANWATVLQIYAFVAALLGSQILPGPIAGLVNIAIMVAIFAYLWFVIRTSLQTTGAIAVLFLLVDLLLTVTIDMVIR